MHPARHTKLRRALTHVVREPNDPLYAKQWRFDLPQITRNHLTRRGDHRRTATSCAHMMRWWVKFPMKNHAGAGGTTTT